MTGDIPDRKPNKRQQLESQRQNKALRDIDRVAELGMNSDIGKRHPNKREDLERARQRAALRNIDRIGEQSEIIGKRHPNKREDLEKSRQSAALRNIDRIGEQSEIIGTSSLHRVAGKTAQRYGGNISGNVKDDPAEIWGRRLGRGLALLVLGWLVYYVYVTYL